MRKIQHLKTFLGMNRFESYMVRLERQREVQIAAQREHPMDLYQSLRFPSEARIVFYSNDVKAESALKSIFPNFELFNPSNLALNETDEALSSKVSDTLFQIRNPGVLLKGYPFNPNQALLLDQKLRGINLAIFFHNKDSQYESSIQDILNYYDKTGSLLKWEVKNTLEDTMLKLKDTITSQIKLN